ncbi:MAG: InlB B-repeat-containing protein [Clostridiales bacterium]|nr:InlB B-repeat-containing protein [Clostridiales bacterium]
MKKLLPIITAVFAATMLSFFAVGCGGDKTAPDGGDTIPQYTVTWYDENGAVLTTQKLKEGTVPSYTYTKQDTAEWDYTVHGWAATLGGTVLQSLPAVSGEASYYAVVSKVKQEYTVEFDSKGGSEVPSVTKKYGETVDEPTQPTPPAGKAFVRWCTDETCQTAAVFPISVVGNITLYAEWMDKTYPVKWYDENGNLLATQDIKEGTVPSYTYTKQDTAEWDYTVHGWVATLGGTVLQSLPAVSGEASYYAVVSKVKQEYTVTFDSKGGSAVPSVTKKYGETVDEPVPPTLEEKRFLGWCTDSQCTKSAVFPIVVTGNITLYAAWGNTVNVKALLSSLLDGYQLNPYSYIPEAMLPTYEKNYVNADTVKKTESDYASFVNKSQMPSRGFGEQWHMIADNLKQSQTFFNALSAVETVSAAIITAFNNYVDSNPSDTAHYAFTQGIYNVTIDCGGSKIYCVLDYTGTFPVVGTQTAQIAMSMSLLGGDRTVRIQLGEPNALAYTIKEDGYTFALKMLGVRRAMFDVSRDHSGKVTGHINEFLTASGVTDAAIASAADFYINGNYVSAVGNKASGLKGFDGYISELYNSNTGKLISYEVRETNSVATFNTLWFDLADISGINSIKAVPKEENEYTFYVNDLTKAWANKKMGLTFAAKVASRRFDIEFRSQYFYAKNGDEVVEVEVQVPMLFIQEEVYDDFVDDVKKTNSVDITVNVSATDLNRQKFDYETLIDKFIENKGNISVEYIIDFIGDKKTF